MTASTAKRLSMGFSNVETLLAAHYVFAWNNDGLRWCHRVERALRNLTAFWGSDESHASLVYADGVSLIALELKNHYLNSLPYTESELLQMFLWTAMERVDWHELACGLIHAVGWKSTTKKCPKFKKLTQGLIRSVLAKIRYLQNRTPDAPL
jgi:hypothetical protein